MDEAEVMAVTSAIRSGWIAQGPQVSAFEREFSRALGVPYAVALSSGTSALEMALTLLGIGPGDDVLVPSLTFIATANAVSRVGARPIFADVSPTTGAVTATTLTQARTAATAAAIIVHQAGIPADVDAIALAIPDLPIIEDAACAAGSLTRGRPTGSQARLAAWSFHPRKLVTTGEGGMLTTTDGHLAERVRSLREHGTDSPAAVRHAAGSPARESYLARGFNMRMTDVQAALGRVQLTRLHGIVQRRRELAAVYADHLAGDPRIMMMSDPDYGVTNFQSLWVRLSPELALTTSALLRHLHDHGITGRHGIMAVHRQPAYRDREHGPLPVTDELTDRSVILPLFHQMTHHDVARVSACVLEAVNQ
jgi:perosamine synthetase